MQEPTGKSGGGLEPRVIQAIGGAAVITGLHAFALHVLGGSRALVVGIGLLAIALAVWFCVAVVRRRRGSVKTERSGPPRR